MQLRIYLPPTLSGHVRVPASKSLCNRMLALSVLASGRGGLSGLGNLSDCDDTQAMLRALSGDGARVDIGAAGTAMRFLAALFAVTPGSRELTGSPRMLQRPVGVLVDALRSLGAEVDYAGREGYPPLRIRGHRLRGGTVRLSAGVSSQYVSALLMIGPTMAGGLRLELEGDVVSRPYIDMTLGLMRAFGAVAGWTGDHSLAVDAVPYRADSRFDVENDWSGASYWYEAVALSPDAAARLFLPGLRADSLQGDAAVARYFGPLGVATEFADGGIVLTKQARAAGPGAAGGEAVVLDLAGQPDLAQTIAVTCAMQGRPFRLSGLGNLRIKETDRLAALQAELGRLGYAVDAGDDGILAWDGRRCAPALSGGIATYDDHRMAMAFAPCAYRFPGLAVRDPGVVSKSYPGFWDEWRRLGARLVTE